MKHLILSLMATCWMCAHAHAQTPTSVEAAEYDPNSDRWFVSNGSSILATSDLGESWTVFGNGGATHGMEVLGSTLFVIQNNVIRAYDVVSGEPGAGRDRSDPKPADPRDLKTTFSKQWTAAALRDIARPAP